MNVNIKTKKENLKEKKHFANQGLLYGSSWWGQATEAGRKRLKRKQQILDDFLKRRHNQSVLEIGCGAGELTNFVENRIRTIAIDISFDLVKIAKEKNTQVTYLLGDATSIPFKDKSFDAVVGDGILHHVNLSLAMDEINRVLKKGGSILFFEPNMLNPQIFLERNIGFIKKFHQTSSETAFTKWQIKKLLKRKGWENIYIQVFDFLHPATPRMLISLVGHLGFVFEKTPLLKEIAGSLYIEAIKAE